jgi:ankyrin repeat protein
MHGWPKRKCHGLQGGKLNVHDKRGRTPLHWAASEGHTACTLLIIEKGADVNAKTQAGTTALHWVAVQGCVDTAKILIQSGADVNARNNDGYTPYDRAHDEAMKKLLKEAGGRQTLGWWDLH